MFVYLCMISLAGWSWTKQISDSMHHTSRTHGTKQPLTGKSNNTWTTVVQKTDGEKVNPGNTRSFSCPDETGGFEKKVSVARAKRTAEWIIEKESVWKLGSVTDLASVCLRSISSRLKLNTMSHSTLRCVYSYSEALLSRVQMLVTLVATKDARFVQNRENWVANTLQRQMHCAKARRTRIARWNSFRDAFSCFSHQCYPVTRCVRAKIWLKPFTLSNVHGIKTDGLCRTGAKHT